MKGAGGPARDAVARVYPRVVAVQRTIVRDAADRSVRSRAVLWRTASARSDAGSRPFQNRFVKETDGEDVAGAWAFGRAACWDRLVPGLRAAGHDVEAIDLPGAGEDPTPVAEDAHAMHTRQEGGVECAETRAIGG